MELFVEHFGHVTLVLRNASSTNVEAIVAEELIYSVHNVVSDKAVEAHKEVCA